MAALAARLRGPPAIHVSGLHDESMNDLGSDRGRSGCKAFRVTSGCNGVPHTVIFGAPPKTSTGKMRKFLLRERVKRIAPEAADSSSPRKSP